MTSRRAHVAELLDALDFERWQKTLTRCFLCAECGARVELPPPRETEEPPTCCAWEMVELPPADFCGPNLRVVE